jgi:1,4-dihydroxy-2-naphthoate octaprenyltransferase
MERITNRKENNIMSKRSNVLNYTVMACAVISAVIFFLDQNWLAALWAIIALGWIINSHLAEESYYDYKESLDKLTDDYFNLLISHGKEVKELKDEIESLKKGE